MADQKNVQIPFPLFLDLVSIHLLEDPDPERWDRVRQQLNDKLDAIVTRDAYTRSKTANTPQEREKARIEYLDRKGIKNDFRW